MLKQQDPLGKARTRGRTRQSSRTPAAMGDQRWLLLPDPVACPGCLPLGICGLGERAAGRPTPKEAWGLQDVAS